MRSIPLLLVHPSFCEVLISPLSTALTTSEIIEAGFFTIIASVGHSLKKGYE
jgi:hypothetical protein